MRKKRLLLAATALTTMIGGCEKKPTRTNVNRPMYPQDAGVQAVDAAAPDTDAGTPQGDPPPTP